MTKLVTNNMVMQRPKNMCKVTTEFGQYVMNKVNDKKSVNLALEKFIQSMKECKHTLIVGRDNEDEFMVFTRFGEVYNHFNGMYIKSVYPKPSELSVSTIRYLIETEMGFNDWDNVAEMSRFLALTDEQKDKEGFAFYNWIWEESLGDCEPIIIGRDDSEGVTDWKGDLIALAELKKQMEQPTSYTQNVIMGDLDALAMLKKSMEEND